MADRFPSLDFDSGSPGAGPSTDDFLAREKALLGDDADQFATNNDSAAFEQDDDLLGGGDSAGANQQQSTFESQFPDLAQQNEDVGPAGTITGSGNVKEARQNIDDFYENYNSKKEKSIAQTRKDAEQFLANREDTVSGGTSWERIAKLVDVSGKGVKGGAAGSGKERFRELLTSLKKDEKAPGAVGY
ncbi:clathrin light chain [Verticillium dahliae]|nr:clathrin light chain [Verticillium dahliae]